MWLYHTVHALVKGPGGEVTRPVVVLAICIGEKISTQNRVVGRSGSLGRSVRFVHGVEVVWESAKLGLREQPRQMSQNRLPGSFLSGVFHPARRFS